MMYNRVVKELKKAISTEVEGYSFYLAAADFVEDEKGEALFRQLARDELDHIKALTSLSVALEKEGKWVDYEEAITIGALLSEKERLPLVPDKKLIPKLLGKKATEVDALKFGMKLEEDAYDYYSEVLRGCKDKDEISFFTSMRNIENSHLKLLVWKHDSVTKSGFWCDCPEFTIDDK